MITTTKAGQSAAALVARAAASTVGSLFVSTARLYPQRVAIEDDGRVLTFAQLAERVNRTASALATLGVTRGARVAVLSENRLEYIETQLACALLGAITACQNWRLSQRELEHCIGLVAPAAILISPRHAGILSDAVTAGIPVFEYGAEWERRLAAAAADTPSDVAEPEDPLLILYTSGTTGMPKGAVLTHRSQLARMTAAPFDLGVRPGNTNLCWPPLYHLGGSEPAHYALLTGGRVIVLDSFDPERIADKIETERFEWVSFMPGTLGRMIQVLERRGVKPRGLRTCGVMADLSPPAEVARLSELLGADFLNCFGSTETGTPPLSGRRLRRGATGDLGKAPSICAEIRLVDQDDNDVPDGGIGELAMRGPTLFSGYWNNEAATRKDFRNGWFHMGDLLRRRPDGLYDFVDRAKYLIKSGGENIYPAEIERVLIGHPDVRDAVVVRKKDDRWGEIPVAVVVSANPRLETAELSALCRRELAGFKQPKAIHFVPPERIVRSTTGKVQRGAIESWVENQTVELS